MKKPELITGLDIGSSKISAVAARIDKDGQLKILAQESRPSSGVSKGALIDLNEAVGSVSKALSRLEEKVSKGLDDIYVNISGETLRGERSRGMTPLSLRGREVTQADVDKCVNVASTIQLPFNRDILHRIVQNFSIDDQSPVKNPLGLYASRLACEVYIITASINHIQNIYKCVNDAGYDIKNIVFTGLANGESLLETEEKERGAAILDIGAGLTEFSIFSGGAFKDAAVISIGSEDFKGDFKTSVEFKNILSKVKNRIEDFLNKGASIASITLTGGLAFADEIIEVLEEELSRPIKIGIAKGLRGNVSSLDGMRLSTAIGLIRYAYKGHEKALLEEKNIVRRISTKVVDIFNNYF